MEFSLCLHLYGMVIICQGFICGKVSVKRWRNILSVRCVSLEAALAILLSVSAMYCMEE